MPAVAKRAGGGRERAGGKVKVSEDQRMRKIENTILFQVKENHYLL